MRLLHRTARAALAGISALVLATACSGESTGVTDLTGTYDLAAINDAPLPFLVAQSSAETEEIVRGWIELDPSGRFSDVTVYRTSGTGIVTQESTEEFTGDYEVAGDQILFHTDQGADYSMARSGSSISQIVTASDGTPFTFRYTK